MTRITAMEGLPTQLRDLGATVDNHQIIKKVICTLPPSFRHAVSAWDNVPEDEKILPLLTTRLLKEETMNMIYGGQSESDAAFFAGRNNGTKKTTLDSAHRSEGCSKYGHFQRNCWRERKPHSKEFVNIASSRSSDQDLAFTSLSLTAHTFGDQSFADSEASQHMADQRAIFDEGVFQEIISGVWPVKGIDRNNSLFVRGRGSVRFKSKVSSNLFDGIVQNVIFIPDLGANLISISAVTKLGITVPFKNDTVRFMKDERTLIPGTRATTSLYLLGISSVNGNKNTSAAIALSYPKDRWSRRLCLPKRSSW